MSAISRIERAAEWAEKAAAEPGLPADMSEGYASSARGLRCIATRAGEFDLSDMPEDGTPWSSVMVYLEDRKGIDVYRFDPRAAHG